MEAKDIAIIALAMILFLLIGFIFGQRRKNTRTLSTDIPLAEKTVESSYSAKSIANINADVVQSASPCRDYSKQIAQARTFHQRAAVVFSVMAENRVYALFNNTYVQIDEAYERFDTDKQEHTREELLALFSSLFSVAKFGDTQKNLTEAAGEIAKSIIEYYDGQVSDIFSGKSFEALSTRYRLNADLRASQLAKISAIVTSHFSTVIAELKDIEQRRSWLQSNYQAFVAATSDEFDWGSAARNFGAGALAVANPIIGIPALIANFKLQADKGKAESAQLDRYVDLCDEFENKIQSVRQQIIQAAEQTKSYVADKFKEVNESAIAEILLETSAGGCILDHYFKSLDFKELESIERELF